MIHFVTYKQPVRLKTINSSLFFHEVNVPDYPLFHYQPYELALSSKLVDTVKNTMSFYMFISNNSCLCCIWADYKILQSENINIPIVTTFMEQT